MPSVMAVLCDILRRNLADQQIGPDDDFYAMGGDSLIALRVVADAREHGILISLRDILYYPTARELSAHVSAEPGVTESTSDGQLTAADQALVPAGVAEALPASALQQAMIYLCDASGDPRLYHSSISWEVLDRFDERAFRTALAQLCHRHPALRTALDLGAYSVAAQLVWSSVEPPLRVTDRSGDEWVEPPLDWGTPPLFRCQVRTAPSSFQVTLLVHHAIIDGWSYGRLIVDLLALYRAASRGEDARLPAVPATIHRTFLEQEREQAGSADAAAYWHRQADVPALLFQRSRFSGAADARESAGFDLPDELVERLRLAARKARVPLKSLALAAHWWALGALAERSRDVVTGVVVNTRPELPGADQAVGLYLNTVPLRSPVLAGTWSELAEAALAAERGSSAYHAYPLAHIEHRLGRPAFDATFNFTHFHVYEDLNRLAGLAVRSWQVRGKPSFPFRVDFEVAGMESGSRVVVAFDPELLPATDARRYALFFEQALTAAAAQPSAPAAAVLTGSVR